MGAANQPTPPSAQRVNDDYIIGPSDILAINVWKDPELTRNVPVRPDGKITLPLIGEMQVSGLTALDVQRLVTQRLKEYVAKPEVTVIVQEVKSRTLHHCRQNRQTGIVWFGEAHDRPGGHRHRGRLSGIRQGQQGLHPKAPG